MKILRHLLNASAVLAAEATIRVQRHTIRMQDERLKKAEDRIAALRAVSDLQREKIANLSAAVMLHKGAAVIPLRKPPTPTEVECHGCNGKGTIAVAFGDPIPCERCKGKCTLPVAPFDPPVVDGGTL